MNYDLFEALCRKSNTTPTALTNKLGLSKGNSSSWKKGGNPSADVLVKLADELNCTTDELLGRNKVITDNSDEEQLLEYYNELDDISKASVLGKAEGLAEAARRKKALEAASKEKPKAKITPFPEPDLSDDEDDEDEEEYIEIPFAELPVSAGTGVYLHSDSIDTIKVAANDKNRKADFAIKVSGNSMEPRFCNGDIVLVREQPVEVGEIGIFVYEGEGYIKELGENRLISINPDYEDIHIKDPDSLFCQGKVISVLRLGKKKQ